jgi:protein-disulfide isomerase
MNKTTGIILGIIVLAFGGLLTWSIIQSQNQAVDYNQFDAGRIIPGGEHSGNIDEHVRGDASSPVVLVEYADMQCAGCATAMPRVSKLKEEYGDRVAFVFRHFPIQGHPNARAAAAAVESAGMQGYFWEMLETMFANQALWSGESGANRTNTFASLFNKIAPDGDVDRFINDLGDKNIEKKITFDYNIGMKLSKVTGTPSFFVNGELIDISQAGDEAGFMKVMREGLDRALKAEGLPTGPAETEEEE